MLRVMVDANVLFTASVWPRWPYEVLIHAMRGNFKLVLCPQVIEEARRRLEMLYPERAGRLSEILAASSYEAVPDPTPEEVQANQALLRDLTDVPIALAAIHAQVDCFVTQDKDFTDSNTTTLELHRRLTILLPGTFLREYMGWTSEALEAIRKRTWRDLNRG